MVASLSACKWPRRVRAGVLVLKASVCVPNARELMSAAAPEAHESQGSQGQPIRVLELPETGRIAWIGALTPRESSEGSAMAIIPVCPELAAVRH